MKPWVEQFKESFFIAFIFVRLCAHTPFLQGTPCTCTVGILQLTINSSFKPKPTEQLHNSRWGLNGSLRGTLMVDRQPEDNYCHFTSVFPHCTTQTKTLSLHVCFSNLAATIYTQPLQHVVAFFPTLNWCFCIPTEMVMKYPVIIGYILSKAM